jgi:hypothetical protein
MSGYLESVKSYSDVDSRSPQTLADGLDKAYSDIGAMGLLLDQASKFRRIVHANLRQSLTSPQRFAVLKWQSHQKSNVNRLQIRSISS